MKTQISQKWIKGLLSITLLGVLSACNLDEVVNQGPEEEEVVSQANTDSSDYPDPDFYTDSSTYDTAQYHSYYDTAHYDSNNYSHTQDYYHNDPQWTDPKDLPYDGDYYTVLEFAKIRLEINGVDNLNNGDFSWGQRNWYHWNDDPRSGYGVDEGIYKISRGGEGSIRLFYVEENDDLLRQGMDVYNSNSPIWIPVDHFEHVKLEFTFKGTVSNAFLLALDKNGNWFNLRETGKIHFEDFQTATLEAQMNPDIVAVGVQFDSNY